MAKYAVGETIPGRSRSRGWLVGGAMLGVILVLLVVAFVKAGTWLVVADSLQPAKAIVVFGGQVPFRAMEAARMYTDNWAREVWLTRGGVDEADEALAKLGIDRAPEYAYSRRVLERLGVPTGAIRLLPGQTQNTAEEVRVVAQELRAAGGSRVILVTSKYHTRRVRAIWHALVGNSPEAIVRYTPDDPFQPQRWWTTSTDAMAVSREWFGLLNAWSGFPLKSTR